MPKPKIIKKITPRKEVNIDKLRCDVSEVSTFFVLVDVLIDGKQHYCVVINQTGAGCSVSGFWVGLHGDGCYEPEEKPCLLG